MTIKISYQQKTKPSSSFNSDLKTNLNIKSDNSYMTDSENELGEILSESDDEDEKSEEKIRKSKKKRKDNSWKQSLKIGPHYNKDKTGNIYKYKIDSLDQKGNAFFKCIDEKCNAMGLFDFSAKKFVLIYKHNLRHYNHEYIKNKKMEKDEIFKSLATSDKSDAQIFKEYREKIFKYYIFN